MMLLIVILLSVICHGEEIVNVSKTTNDKPNVGLITFAPKADSNTVNTTVDDESCYEEIETSTFDDTVFAEVYNETDFNDVWYAQYEIEDYDEIEFVPKNVSDFVLDKGYVGGTIPLLNRKVHRGSRVSIYEFPFVVSIRRNLAHYQIGVILTTNAVLTVAQGIYNVPIYDLTLVVGENYSDRGTDLSHITLMIIHQDFNPYTLQGDLAILRTNFDMVFKGNVKEVMILRKEILILEAEGTVIGWGRCDLTDKDLCMPRSSEFFPNEIIDPMLRSVKIHVDQNIFCKVYRRLMNVSGSHGMLCTGLSRMQEPTVPCMAVPGAPLLIYSYLVGLQSWGYGCGYKQDLPIVYTDIRHYISWLEHELNILLNITSMDLTQHYNGSQAYIVSRTLRSIRGLPPLTDNKHRRLEMYDIDKDISRLSGTVYDYRDFIFDGIYSEQKQQNYKAWRKERVYKEILESVKPNCRQPFLRIEDKQYLYEDEDGVNVEYDEAIKIK